MKIHFDASGRGFDRFGNIYLEIEKIIADLGHQNLNSLFDESVVQQFYEGAHKKRVDRFKELKKSIKEADLLILEVSIHSLSMGYWLQKAIELNKPVIALYLKDYDPKFLEGVKDDKFQLIEYEESEIEEVLKEAIEKAIQSQDTRFNFFISPSHQAYLDWIAKERKIPRSVFLRRLIDEHMRKNKDFNEA